MEFFELAAEDITALNDGQLRELVARLAEAELVEQGRPRSSVHAGGAQEAADGGLDVSVVATESLIRPNFVPRANTGFQVKKHSMSRGNCKKEMTENGLLKPAIAALAAARGAYIIVSGKDNCSATMHAARIAGMQEALGSLSEGQELIIDFYGNDRIALWLKSHPGVALWARAMLGKALAGWRPYGRWAASPPADKDEFLADEHPCVIDGSSRDKDPKSVLDGIELARGSLRAGSRAIRITGLSGVGKTRFAQALFEEGVGQGALSASNVLYADLGEELSPSASTLMTYLIANQLTPYIVLDNCPPDTHRSLQKQLAASGAKLHLLTIEYDISNDSPEETDVIRIEPSSEETVTTLLLRRFTQLDRFNAARIAAFSGGNARVALALADRVDADDTLSSFTDDQLFQRLFSQRKGESADLLHGATVLSLVYSFNVSRADCGDELGVLGAISEISRSALQRDQAELLRRQLAQQRGNWRAVLPHALATRLAKKALDEYEPEDINRELFKLENIRLFQSCAHRLGYMHESARARELALTWMQPGAPLADIGACNEAYLVAFEHVAPVFPDVALRAIEKASETPGFADRASSSLQRYVNLLSTLAYEDSTFDRAGNILLKFALTEHRHEGDGSVVSRLRQLLSLHLSGTIASPATRCAFVERLLASSEVRKREIAGELLHSAFEANSWTALGGFHFGARARSSGWEPGNQAEYSDWYEGFLGLLQPLLRSDSESREWAKSIIATNFRQLWSLAGCTDSLESLVMTYGGGGMWPEIWLAIGTTLEYDGEQFNQAVRDSLEAMQAFAAPVDLESKIATFALVDEWSQPGHLSLENEEATIALRDRVIYLGKSLWTDVSAFDRLAPRILSSCVRPVVWLGQGFAAAGGDSDVILERLGVSLVSASTERMSTLFLEGCLTCLYEVEPVAIQRVVRKLLEIPSLQNHAVELLVATPISPWASKKLIQLAREGWLPAQKFEALQYGRRHEPMVDGDFASLLDAVSELRLGYLSSLRMLIMRLFGRTKREYEPGPEIFSSARVSLGYLLRDRRGARTTGGLHGVGPILVEALGADAPDSEVEELIRLLCNVLQEYRLPLDQPEVLSAFIQSRPEMFLDALIGCAGEDSGWLKLVFRRRSGRHSSFLNEAPIDRLLAWCGTDKSRFDFVAPYICVFETENPGSNWGDAPRADRLSDHFKALLAAAADKKALVETAVDQAVPMSWLNSRVGTMEIRGQALREILSDLPAENRVMVSERLKWLDELIVRERAKEERGCHQREQRFE